MSDTDIAALIQKYTDYVECDEWHIHQNNDDIEPNADENDGHMDFDEDKLLAGIEQKLTDARIQEAGLWLDMVVRHDSSRLDSNEWYKLNPQDVLKFHAERLKALQASKEGK